MTRVMGTVVLTLYACVAAAQTPAPKGGSMAPPAAAMDKAAIEKALIANEQKINDAVAKGDVAAFKSVVGDDAWGIDETGIQAVTEFEKMLKPGMAKFIDMKLDGFKVFWVDASTAVLTYTWTGKGTLMDQPVKSPLLSSTVYTKRGANWVAVFHQETPKAPMPPPAPAKKK